MMMMMMMMMMMLMMTMLLMTMLSMRVTCLGRKGRDEGCRPSLKALSQGETSRRSLKLLIFTESSRARVLKAMLLRAKVIALKGRCTTD